MVMAIDGSTQSGYPAADTATGTANEAASWMIVAIVTLRSMRLPSRLVGLGAPFRQ